MGLKVLEVSSQHAVVHVPLAANLNHVQTVFGGSLYSAAALSCYALFQVIARDAGGLNDNLVIQEGHIHYLLPVASDFTARARLSAGESTAFFIEALRKHGKARLKLEATVTSSGKDCANFSGVYVFKK